MTGILLPCTHYYLSQTFYTFLSHTSPSTPTIFSVYQRNMSTRQKSTTMYYSSPHTISTRSLLIKFLHKHKYILWYKNLIEKLILLPNFN